MKYVGAHVSISGGVNEAPGRGVEIGAKALGIFSKNQRKKSYDQNKYCKSYHLNIPHKLYFQKNLKDYLKVMVK